MKEDYKIKSKLPKESNWKVPNFSHRQEILEKPDGVTNFYKNVEGMPIDGMFDINQWEEYLDDKGFEVQWSGTDADGSEITFDNLVFTRDGDHVKITGKGFMGSFGESVNIFSFLIFFSLFQFFYHF